MYNSSRATQQGQSRIPTEQVVFDYFADYANSRQNLGPVEQLTYQHLSSDNWYNVAVTDAVKSILDLMAARMSRSNISIDAMLPECVRVVYDIVSSLIVKRNIGFYNQLMPHARDQIELNLQMANMVSNEIKIWQDQQNQPIAPHRSHGGTRSSIYSRMSGGMTNRGPIPATLAAEQVSNPSGSYRPSRQGLGNGPTMEPAKPTQSPGIYKGNRGGAAKVISGTVATTTTKPVVSNATKEPEMNNTILTQTFNPNTHDARGQKIMDYRDHQPANSHFPVITTSQSVKTDVLRIAAGGLVFDPLSLENKEQPVTIPTDLSERVIDHGETLLASGPRHAELILRTKLLEQGVSLNNAVLSFEYRDFSPIMIFKTKEDCMLAVNGSALYDLNTVTTITDVLNLIGELQKGGAVDKQVANIVNLRATEFINDFMAFALGLEGWVTTDFYGDWQSIIDALQSAFADKLEWLQSLMKEYTEAFIARTTGSVYFDFDVDVAAAINKLAGIQSPTLRQRSVMLSDLHAVLDLPLEAHELGCDMTKLPAILTPNNGCELLYGAVADFLDRLNFDPAAYRTITILTSDERMIRIRPSDLACGPGDTRRAIVITDVRRD